MAVVHPLDSRLRVGVSHLGLVVDGQLVSDIPELDTPRAMGVAVSSEGTVAFKRPGEGNTNTLEKWDPHSGEHTVVTTVGNDVGDYDWGPDGALAYAEPSTSSLKVLRPDGTQDVMSLDVPVVGLAWQASEIAAATPWYGSDPPTPGAPVNTAAGEILGRTPPGWRAQTWSPDGEVLLLSRESQVAVLRPGDADITVLGSRQGGRLHGA